MQLKHRFPLAFSLLFSLLLAIVMLTIYQLFSNYRKQEFKERLAGKAETTVKLLLEVQEVDVQLLKVIDRNNINRLYNEKTLVFNDQMQLIYSSIDDATISWDIEDLKQIKKEKVIFKTSNEYDVLGLYYRFEHRDYYALIAANDKYGKSKLIYLRLLLFGAFVIGATSVWALSFYLSKQTLHPLDRLRRQMQAITSQNLTVQIEEPEKQDEIKALAQSFNQMMSRIEKAYSDQKYFTSNASHELRTPIARIVMQLENLQNAETTDLDTKEKLKEISNDAYFLSDIVTSLLLLSKIENNSQDSAFQVVRIDEIIFYAAAKLQEIHGDFKLHFDIENNNADEVCMDILGDETLLKIAFSNLLKNAYLYSSNQMAYCILIQHVNTIEIVLRNAGATPVISNTSSLFQTFFRGNNAKNKPGTGMGLSIVKRIFTYHNAAIVYRIPDDNTNEISVSFKKAAKY